MSARNDVGLVLRVEGLLALIRTATGEAATAIYHEDHVEVVLTANQQARLGKVLGNMMAGKPSRIRIDVLPIVGPALMERFGLIAAAILAGAFVVGRLSRE